jgi:signal recognition particle GTPase
MLNKEKEQQRSKKSIAAEVIYSEKSTEVLNHIKKIKEKMTNLSSSVNISELLEFINKLNDEMDYLGEELMRQDIRVSIATGLIDQLRPYPIKERIEEVNKEIENRVNSKNFSH